MYGFIWRILPGPLWFRIFLALILFALTIVALATWVFPWMNTFMPPIPAPDPGVVE